MPRKQTRNIETHVFFFNVMTTKTSPNKMFDSFDFFWRKIPVGHKSPFFFFNLMGTQRSSKKCRILPNFGANFRWDTPKHVFFIYLTIQQLKKAPIKCSILSNFSANLNGTQSTHSTWNIKYMIIWDASNLPGDVGP